MRLKMQFVFSILVKPCRSDFLSSSLKVFHPQEMHRFFFVCVCLKEFYYWCYCTLQSKQNPQLICNVIILIFINFPHIKICLKIPYLIFTKMNIMFMNVIIIILIIIFSNRKDSKKISQEGECQKQATDVTRMYNGQIRWRSLLPSL